MCSLTSCDAICFFYIEKVCALSNCWSTYDWWKICSMSDLSLACQMSVGPLYGMVYNCSVIL